MSNAKDGKTDPTITVNRRARYDYDIVETFEAGLVLTGTEVKALRDGKASLAQAFAMVRSGEAWLVQAHIPEYAFGNRANHDPTRRRKLLLHSHEIDELERFTQEQGRTLVPMRLYWSGGRAKVEIGLARGKTQHDKRKTIAERDANRAMQRALSDAQRR